MDLHIHSIERKCLCEEKAIVFPLYQKCDSWGRGKRIERINQNQSKPLREFYVSNIYYTIYYNYYYYTYIFKTESTLKVEVQLIVVSCGISPNTFQSKVFSVLTFTDPNVRNTNRPPPTFSNREGQPTRDFIAASIPYLYITHSGSQMISLKQFLKDFN